MLYKYLVVIISENAHLYKVVDGLQEGEVIVIQVHTETEEQASIASVHYLEVAKLKQTISYLV